MGNGIHDCDEESDQSGISRRQLLALTSGATMAGLAGCSGGQDPNEPGVGNVSSSGMSNDSAKQGNNDSGKQVGESATTELSIRAPVSWTPKNSNINTFATQGDIEYWMQYMWWESLVYPNAVGDPIWWLADDISLKNGGCSVDIKLNENYTWWDGTPVTAKDVRTAQIINDYQTYSGPDQTDDSWEVNGDYELVHNLSGPANPALQKVAYLGLVAKHDYFKSWIQKFEDAGGEKAVDRVSKDLQKHKITLGDLTENGLGCGLWKPTQFDPTQVVHEKYQDHPRADWTNLETFTWRLVADDQKAIQAMQANRFDMGDKLVAQLEKNDQLEVFSQFTTGGLPKLTLNYHNKHLARRPVRRAIAYLIDNEELVQVIKNKQGKQYKPHRNVSGMSSVLYDPWLPEDFRGKLIDYGKSAKPEKAKETLENAGYTKNGDVWVGPDGDPMKGLQYLTPPWSIYETIGKYVSPTLEEFGIKNKLVIPSSSTFFKTWEDTYKFDICNWFGSSTHPANAYTTASAQGFDNYEELVKATEQKNQGCKVNRSVPELEQTHSKKLNQPIRPQYPKKVGAKKPGGNRQTLYPIKWHNIITQSQDKTEIKDLTQKLAWFYNWEVPHVGLYEETASYWGNTNQFEFPKPNEADDHPNAKATLAEHKTTAMEFLTKGHINAKTK